MLHDCPRISITEDQPSFTAKGAHSSINRNRNWKSIKMKNTTHALIVKAASQDLNSIYHLVQGRLAKTNESSNWRTAIALLLILTDLELDTIMLLIVQGKSRISADSKPALDWFISTWNLEFSRHPWQLPLALSVKNIWTQVLVGLLLYNIQIICWTEEWSSSLPFLT